MSNSQQKDKLHFQIERIAFFSDAVIAIAVTLLIIEIKAPKITEGSGLHEQLEQLNHLIPEFVSFIISFWIIVMQWTKHHKMFGNIINYDKKLITLNSFFLFIIALIPFSTSYVALNNNSSVYLPFVIYGFSLFLVTFLNYLLFKHITDPKNALYDKSVSQDLLKWERAEYLLLPLTFLLTLVLSFINFKLGLFVYAFSIFFGSNYINKQKKKHATH